MRIYAGRFPSTRMFARRGHYWQSWRPDQRTPMQENTSTMTHTSNHVLSKTEIHKHTKQKSLSCKRCPQPGAVATTSWRLQTIANSEHASSRSNAAIANTHGQQRWSCPSLHNSRVSREKCCRSWRLDQPLQRGSKFNNDRNQLMYSSQRNDTNIHIKNQ